MKTLRNILTIILTAALLCTSVFASSGFNAGLTIDRGTDGQISVTVENSSVLEEKKPTLTILCDYTYAKVTCPDGTTVYYTGTGSEISFSVFVGGTYLIESVSELPPDDGNGDDDSGGDAPGGNGGSSNIPGDDDEDLVDPPSGDEDDKDPTDPPSDGDKDDGSKPVVRPDAPDNEEGSSTVTKVDKVTGTVTTTTTTTTGVTGTMVTTESGTVTEVKAVISEKAVENAVNNKQAVMLPVEVTAAMSSKEAVAVEISLPDSVGEVTVEIPVTEISSGLVAVIVHEDGTEEIVKKSVVLDKGVALTVNGNAVVKIIDNSTDFSDISSDDWYEDAADFVSARGLFGGVSTTEAVFGGDGAMTRGMLAVVLHRLENEQGVTLDYAFDDVGGGLWYSEAVSWAAQEGIVTGYGNTFGPMDNITREQLAVMLWRYAGSPVSTHDLSHCPDANQISAYARQAMAWANDNGIISGIGANVLAPKGNATRAQVAQMLKNYLENI